MCFVTGDCSAGYYCTSGAWIPDHINSTEGDKCPLYHICPTGSDAPVQCDIGYYANNTGLSTCSLCIAGYVCYPGVAPALCPQGKKLFHIIILFVCFFCLMVLNATFNNISIISWQSVLLVEETVGSGENHRPVASH